MKRSSLSSWLALCALLTTLLAVSAHAQLQTGNIYGKVQGKDGSAIPGVTVTITGNGAPQVFVTGAQGDFRFISLSPGTYSLTASLEGYGEAKRPNIMVNVGRNVDVTLTLNPTIAGVKEVITVTAEPLLDVRKSVGGTTVPQVELEKIPTSRDPWTVLQSTPSVQVDRINVGGSQSGQQSVYMAKGAANTDNTFNVDGVNITDMGATGSSPLYFDFDSFEEMQITTGGSDPRVMTPGVQLNMVTKRGSNDIRGSSRYFYTPGSLQASTSVPAEAQGYLSQTNAINYVRDYGAEVGGPIWKDHLWLWLADSENKISNAASVSASGAGGSLDNIILRDKNAKLNGQITASNSAVGFYTFGDKVRNARDLSVSRPFDSAWRQTGPTKVYKIEDTQIFGSSLYLTGMWSKVSGGFSLIPNGGTGPTDNVLLDTAGVWHNSFLAFTTDRPQKQERIDGSKFFDLGSSNNELKFGFGYRSTPISSTSAWPGAAGGFLRQRSSAYCANRGFAGETACYTAGLTRAREASFDEKYNDMYAGDTILMGNLTLQAGLRYDMQKSANNPTVVPGNPLLSTPLTLPCAPNSASAVELCGSNPTGTTGLPALNYPGDSQDLKWNSLSPRIGLTYALGADKKTLLRAGYNRYVSQMGGTVSPASPLGAINYAYALGNDTNGDGIIQRNELLAWQQFYYFAPNNPSALSSTLRINYNMKPPKADEFTLGAEREVMTDFAIGANLTYRKYTDIVAPLAEKTQGSNNFYTRADYQVAGTTPTTYTNSDGTVFTLPSVTYYDLKPGVPIPQFTVLTNRPGYSQQYKGLELTATKRLSHNWMLRGNVTFNDYTENCSEAASPDPTPFLGNCPGGQVTLRSAGSGAFGNVFISSKWSYNVTGLYQLPWDFNVGASLTGRHGYPEPFRVNASTLANVETDKNIVLQPIGSLRFDNVYELDLRAAKDFRFFNRVGVTISADLFNAPDQRTILQRNTDLNTTTFGRITELQSPRVWRLGAKVSF